MKSALVVMGEVRQIMLVAENETEKMILKQFRVDDTIEVSLKTGSFTDNPDPYGYRVGMCQGGYLRAYQDNDATMLVLRPMDKDAKTEG